MKFDAIQLPQLVESEVLPIDEYPRPKRKRKSLPIGRLSLAYYKPKKNAAHPFNISHYPPKRKK